MERIPDDVWKCGPFQVAHVFFVQLSNVAAVWSVYLMMFGNYDPGWRCLQYRHRWNDSSFSLNEHNFSKEFRYVSKVQNKIETNVFLLEINITGKENMSTCDIYPQCDIIEFEPDSKTLVTEFHLICDKAYASSLIIAIQMIGMLFSSFVIGQIGELFGRKISLYSSDALCFIFNLLAIFSPSWQVYAVFMFFIGAGCSGIMLVNGLYMMEFLEPKWRARLTSLPTWNISLGLFAIATYVTKNWVYIHIITASLNAFALIGVFWTPESVRWLLVHKKHKKVRQVIEKIMRINKRDRNIDALENLYSAETGEQLDRKYTYLDLFRSRKFFVMTLKVSTLWFFILMIYFSLSFNVNSLAGNFYVNIIIAGLAEIPIVLMIGPLANAFGRRRPLAAFLFISCLGCTTIVISYFILTEDITDLVITYSALFAKSTIVGSILLSFLVSIELYPTAIRNLAMAFFNIVSKVGSILAPFIIPGDRHSLVIVYLIIAVVLILNIFVTLTLPETKDQSLQDHLKDENMSVSEDEGDTKI